MKIKVKQIVDSFAALEKLAEKKLIFSASFLVANNIGALLPIVENFNKKRTEIIELYGEKDSEGNIAQDENGNIKILDGKSFQIDMTELLDCELEVSLTPLKKSLFETVEMEPKELFPLLYLFESDENPE